jgi:stearoyl-CoA desaturase (delta-9 desaturase)
MAIAHFLGCFVYSLLRYFATAWWLWLLLPLQFLMSPIHGAIINWFAHKYGYTNFEVRDTSKNFLPVDVSDDGRELPQQPS